MRHTSDVEARLRAAVSLPVLLAAVYDAFEAIRVRARACELRDPGLFAAFMATANAAVDGREALTAAPSLPPDPSELTAPATARLRGASWRWVIEPL